MDLLYRGPSMVDGEPIVALATHGSDNRKTGPMVQVYILREDVHPLHATRTGQDVSVCGTCVWRGDGQGQDRGCYVTVQHGPAAVWRAYQETRPEVVSPRNVPVVLSGERVRLGAYGDPAAVPYPVWRAVLAEVVGWTGYTHQWRTCDRRLRRYLMASVDTEQELTQARQAGWRTFRVRDPLSPLSGGEISCPAGAEAGFRTTCAKCLLCDGVRRSDLDVHRRKDIAILPHRTPGVVFRVRQGTLGL